ncbi:ABC transporter permease [Paractinoplanes maris]|uniref:ABC transporter permease n=1 Tax=Paractinoplanes maris TaxID=1734446 RepID=UPI0020208E51|nr:ABC transporter permease [Actinoplanes maris]
MTVQLRPAGLRLSDMARVAVTGMRARPLRAFLSALGVALGIAAMVAVMGVSASSRAEIDRTLQLLGTNLLTVGPGQNLTGKRAELPMKATAMVRRIGPVTAAAATGAVTAKVYRTDRVPTALSGGIAVLAADLNLPATVGGQVHAGDWLNPAAARLPTAVLGSAAARRLGLERAGNRIWLGQRWFSVTGILAPVPLAPELDSAVLIGWDAARDIGFDGHPTTLYCRSEESQVEAVRSVLAGTANPAAPNEVLVSRPSDALAAQRATDQAFSGLLVGIGAVALLVGGIGVANTMVVGVLERRAEIGLRRSMGATRGHIRIQFLSESLLLSLFGGAAGAALGWLLTVAYAFSRDWPPVVPTWALLSAVAGTGLVGVVAGLYPAVRASRLSPTEALTAP